MFVVLGPGFVEHCWLGLFFGIPVATKFIVNWRNEFDGTFILVSTTKSSPFFA